MTHALNKLVVVNSRFARSVSLVRNVMRHDALQGYILTPTGRERLASLGRRLVWQHP